MAITEPLSKDTVSGEGAPIKRSKRSVATRFSFERIGAVYVLIAIWVAFSFAAPETFPTFATIQQIANANAVTAVAALGLTIAIAAGLFDLSFPYIMTLSGIVAAKIVVSTELGVLSAMAIAIVVALVMGLVNTVVVIRMGIDSFIGTLATGSVIAAVITFVTGGTDVSGLELSEGFSTLGQTSVGGFDVAVVLAVILSAAVWVLLEHTAVGRRLYAVGFNFEAARLTGINGNGLRIGALLTSAAFAGFGGIVLASSVSSASVQAGTHYLLPAFAAVFLGATQFKGGRVNAWGTVIAVVLLGTGATGLALAGAPIWADDLFTGIVLIAALTVTSSQRRKRRSGAPRQSRRMRGVRRTNDRQTSV